MNDLDFTWDEEAARPKTKPLRIDQPIEQPRKLDDYLLFLADVTTRGVSPESPPPTAHQVFELP